MSPSPALFDFLEVWEGPPSLFVRADPVATGVYDIGFGHVCKQGHPPISLLQADDMLRDDVEECAAAVNDMLKAQVTQYEFDALVSLAFNIGTHALETSTLMRKINAGDMAGAAAEFARWNKSGKKIILGLVKRRAAEKLMFVDGRYEARP